MAEYIMLMRGVDASRTTDVQWRTYINKLIETGKFRGGSAFGNGRCLSQNSTEYKCINSGFMRFEANTIEEIEALVADNPVYQAGGEVELHELVVG